MRTLIAMSAMAICVAPAMAQEQAEYPPIRYQPEVDSPIETRNPNGPPQLAEYDFVIGDWDVDITLSPPNREPMNYRARWHNHWILNGMVVMQEWRGPFATGAEIRFYNRQAQRWEGENIYPAFPGGTKPTTSQRFEDRMEVTIESETPQGEPMLNREIYTDITEDSFTMSARTSLDGGETWSDVRYFMTATRIAEAD